MTSEGDQRTAIIFTALPVEANAVLEHLQPGTVDDVVAGYMFEVGQFQEKGRHWKVAVVELGPGNVETATVVPIAADYFQPDVMLFVGIAGTLKGDDAGLGDVVAGVAVSWTERAKESKDGRLHRPQVVDASHLITQMARKVARRGSWRDRRKAVGEQSTYRAVVGQIASGEELVAAAEKKDALRALLSDALAVENEGYGFSRAAQRVSGNPEFMVIRGICDSADAAKNDDFHGVAAASAAAFAFELLAMLPFVDALPPTTASTPGLDMGESHSKAGESLSAWFTKVLTDEDLIDDSQAEVFSIANDLVSRGLNLDEGLIGVVKALDTATSSVLRRRMAWLAQQLVEYADTQEPSFLDSDSVDDAIRTSPRGSSLALLEPVTWVKLPSRIKRRLATVAFGPTGNPHVVDGELAPLIIRLIQDDLLSEDEMDRFNAALALDDYGTLGKKGVPLSLLAERIADDVESGNFDRQNPAARYLYRTEEEVGSETLSPDQDVRLGAALIDAAEGLYSANGAVEAIDIRRLVSWPESRLAGGLHAAITGPGRNYLRWKSTSSAKNLIAAATTKDALEEVLGMTSALITSSLEQPQGADTHVLFAELDKIEEMLSPEDVASFRLFREQLQALLEG